MVRKEVKRGMKTKRNKDYPLEYEDYGGAGMYLFAVMAVLCMIAVVILFALMVAGGMVIISEVMKWTA